MIRLNKTVNSDSIWWKLIWRIYNFLGLCDEITPPKKGRNSWLRHCTQSLIFVIIAQCFFRDFAFFIEYIFCCFLWWHMYQDEVGSSLRDYQCIEILLKRQCSVVRKKAILICQFSINIRIRIWLYKILFVACIPESACDWRDILVSWNFFYMVRIRIEKNLRKHIYSAKRSKNFIDLNDIVRDPSTACVNWTFYHKSNIWTIDLIHKVKDMKSMFLETVPTSVIINFMSSQIFGCAEPLTTDFTLVEICSLREQSKNKTPKNAKLRRCFSWFINPGFVFNNWSQLLHEKDCRSETKLC